MAIGNWCLEDLMGDRYSPRGKIGKGLGFGGGFRSGLQVAESEQGLDVLRKRGLPVAWEVLSRWKELTKRNVSV